MGRIDAKFLMKGFLIFLESKYSFKNSSAITAINKMMMVGIIERKFRNT